MKKTVYICAVAALLLLSTSGVSEAFRLTFDADDNGVAITWSQFPFLGTGKVFMTGPEDDPQTVKVKFLFIPVVNLTVSISSITTEGDPKYTVHYVLSLNTPSAKPLLDGDLDLPFGHGYFTNNLLYEQPTDTGINYDVQGYINVQPVRSGFDMYIGLCELSGYFKAKADWKTNEIHKIITRDDGTPFMDINLAFRPGLFGIMVDFYIVMTTYSGTLPDDTFILDFTSPVPQGLYNFWFWRERKQGQGAGECS